MKFHDINQVPPTVERGIVINVATEVVSAVAIASALSNAGMPLLVVNCTPRGAGKVLMDELSRQWNFDLLDLELAAHGITLDRLFERIHSDRILILDSDAELRSPLVTARMRQAFADSAVYGAGWIHDAKWLSDVESGITMNGQTLPFFYRERPWIPCAMFRTSYIRAGIAAGFSFKETFIAGAHVRNVEISPELASRGLPFAIQNDTGAEIHAWATEIGLRFDGPSVVAVGNEVSHHHGVSRLAMEPGSENGSPISEVEQVSLLRLRNAYPEYWDRFAQAVEVAQASV